MRAWTHTDMDTHLHGFCSCVSNFCHMHDVHIRHEAANVHSTLHACLQFVALPACELLFPGQPACHLHLLTFRGSILSMICLQHVH